MCKRWANSTLTVVGRLIPVKPSFPSAALEERDPGSGMVGVVSLGGRCFAACSATRQDLREPSMSNFKPLISKNLDFDLRVLHDERMKEGFSRESAVAVAPSLGRWQ